MERNVLVKGKLHDDVTKSQLLKGWIGQSSGKITIQWICTTKSYWITQWIVLSTLWTTGTRNPTTSSKILSLQYLIQNHYTSLAASKLNVLEQNMLSSKVITLHLVSIAYLPGLWFQKVSWCPLGEFWSPEVKFQDFINSYLAKCT